MRLGNGRKAAEAVHSACGILPQRVIRINFRLPVHR
jgi:hypothetical protein